MTRSTKTAFVILACISLAGSTSGCSSLFGCDNPEERTVRVEGASGRRSVDRLVDRGWDCARTSSGRSANSWANVSWAVFTCTKC